ncbi:hypothetical protein ACFPRL_26470 [Pseudoclavibacter helvolus]
MHGAVWLHDTNPKHKQGPSPEHRSGLRHLWPRRHDRLRVHSHDRAHLLRARRAAGQPRARR